jgi:L-ribulose-5-phosphate 3-epimerase
VIAALREIGYTGGLHVELSRHSHLAPEVVRESYRFLEPLVRGSRTTRSGT